MMTSTLYLVVLTPLAVIGRLFGARFLQCRIDPKATTYWVSRQPSAVEDFRRQY